MDDDKILKLQKIIDESKNIVFFGGAGVSTESGIPDFRSADGIFSGKYAYPPEVIVSHDFFMERTAEFYDFYRDRMIFPSAKPNAAHLFLAELERAGKLKAVITQNIDGLHQAAGSRAVFELHGTIRKNRCMRCGKFYPLDYILQSKGVPKCDCGGTVKPEVVLYGEGLDSAVVSGAVKAISEADALIIGGTSLVVYPAAGFIDFFRGKYTAVVNKSSTSADARADLVINAGIGEVFSKISIKP